MFIARNFRSVVNELDAKLIPFENGEDRSPATLELLEALGLENGLPDFILLLKRGRMRWIEIKLEETLHHRRTELRKDQQAAHDLLLWFGHQVDVVRSWAEFWAIVEAEQIPHKPLPPHAEQLVMTFKNRRRPRRRKEAGNQPL